MLTSLYDAPCVCGVAMTPSARHTLPSYCSTTPASATPGTMPSRITHDSALRSGWVNVPLRCAMRVRRGMGQVEETREAEQSARAAAEEAELLRRVVSQLPRPIMASRTETSITLSLARLIKSSGGDKVPL